MVTPHEYVTNVQFFLGQNSLGNVANGTNGVYTLPWSARSYDCGDGCGFYAQATDIFGQIGSSTVIQIGVTIPTNAGLPVAQIAQPAPISGEFGALQGGTIPTVTNGFLTVTGVATNTMSNPVVWHLGIYGLDGSFIRDVTPTNGNTSFVGSTNGVSTFTTNCDLTTLLNGVYNLMLTVSDPYSETITSVTFRLESNLKLGQFSFSQTDAAIPVNGVPLTVVRTYNSINPMLGDFGYGWTWALNDMQVVIESVNGTNRTYAWQYDPLYRMTNENISGTSPTGNLGYGMDAVGNRLIRTGSLGSLGAQSFSYNTNDWINTDKYDANGNTITNASGQPYVYDYENRLTNFNNGAVIIVYDADGNRIRKSVGNTNNYYVVDAQNPSSYAQVLEEITVSSSATNLSKAYTYGLWLISQRLLGASTNFYGHDGHGNVRSILNAAGTVTDTYAYDAYGNLLASSGPTANNYLYCGEQWDPDLDQYYLRDRTLNTGTGRFWTHDLLQGDPVDPASLHKYLYCRDDPVCRTDPRGLQDVVGEIGVESLSMSLDAMPMAAVRQDLGSCGPDVTSTTLRTLQQITATFEAWPRSKQASACSALHGRYARGAWFIQELAYLGYGIQTYPGTTTPLFGSARLGTAPSCDTTVVFAGQCHHAGDVNYLMWGRINWLCHDAFDGPDDPTSPIPSQWGLAQALRAVDAWKYYWHFKAGDPLRFREGARAFTIGGYAYDSWNAPHANVYSQCQIRSGNKCGQQFFQWHWWPEHPLRQPMGPY